MRKTLGFGYVLKVGCFRSVRVGEREKSEGFLYMHACLVLALFIQKSPQLNLEIRSLPPNC
jgi:hypothetical protein